MCLQLSGCENQPGAHLNWVDKLPFDLHDAGRAQLIRAEGESQFRLPLYRDLLQFKLNGGVVQDVKGCGRDRA